MAATEPDAPPAAFPWPPPADRPVLRSFIDTWRDSVFSPTRFFRALPVPGPVGPALLYYLVLGILVAGINVFWRTVFHLAGPRGQAWGPFARLIGEEPVGWTLLLGFLLSPLYLLVQLGFAVLAVHATLGVVGGPRRGAGTTARVLCFGYGPLLFVVVPWIGGVVGVVWMLAIQVVGLREAHGTDGWRAALAVLLPLALAFLLVVVLAGLAALFRARVL